MLVKFTENIRNELKSTIAYCGNYNSDTYSQKFRSSELSYLATKVFPDSCHTKYSENLEQNFSNFLSRRRELVRGLHFDDVSLITELTKINALLVVDWESSLFDGSVTPETDGFIDENCMPPWDTWLGLAKISSSHGQRCLVSWVSPEIAEKVDFAIQVDAASCMSWVKFEEEDKGNLVGWGNNLV